MAVPPKWEYFRITLTLTKFLEVADQKAVEPISPILILNIRTFVESLQQPDFLLPSVELLVVLCQTQAPCFQPHFPVRQTLALGWSSTKH